MSNVTKEELRAMSAEIGKRIRAMRQQRKLTQAELARRTGFHRPNLIRLEKATGGTPDLSTLARLSRALGCHLHELVLYIDSDGGQDEDDDE